MTVSRMHSDLRSIMFGVSRANRHRLKSLLRQKHLLCIFVSRHEIRWHWEPFFILTLRKNVNIADYSMVILFGLDSLVHDHLFASVHVFTLSGEFFLIFSHRVQLLIAQLWFDHLDILRTAIYVGSTFDISNACSGFHVFFEVKVAFGHYTTVLLQSAFGTTTLVFCRSKNVPGWGFSGNEILGRSGRLFALLILGCFRILWQLISIDVYDFSGLSLEPGQFFNFDLVHLKDFSLIIESISTFIFIFLFANFDFVSFTTIRLIFRQIEHLLIFLFSNYSSSQLINIDICETVLKHVVKGTFKCVGNSVDFFGCLLLLWVTFVNRECRHFLLAWFVKRGYSFSIWRRLFRFWITLWSFCFLFQLLFYFGWPYYVDIQESITSWRSEVVARFNLFGHTWLYDVLMWTRFLNMPLFFSNIKIIFFQVLSQKLVFNWFLRLLDWKSDGTRFDQLFEIFHVDDVIYLCEDSFHHDIALKNTIFS